MRHLPWTLALALAAVTACSSPRPSATTLEQQLASNLTHHAIAGQAVVILRDGEVVLRASHGVADRASGRAVGPDDVFPVFSVSKLFASVLVLQLVDAGAVALDQPASRYLPDLPPAWHAITVGQFLDHVSGVPDYWQPDVDPAERVFPASREAMFTALGGRPMLFTPGTATRYTQTNFVVLGAIVEAHYRAPYRQVVYDRIITPLGLAHTSLGKPDVAVVESYRGAGGRLIDEPVIEWPDYGLTHAGLYSTAGDLAAFVDAVRRGRLVSPATLRAVWTPHRLGDGTVGPFSAGWEYREARGFHQVGHEGGNKVRVDLLFRESFDRDVYVIVYLTNGSATNVRTSTLIDSLVPFVVPP